MKKVLTIILIAVFAMSLFADIQQQSIREKLKAVQIDQIQKRISRSINNDPPEWVMENAPVDLTTNYYDYSPGSYNKSPIKVQPNQGGVYMIYHGRDLAASTRRIWASYVDASGNVTETGTNCSTFDLHEGYPGMDIDPTTGDPFAAWHVNFDDDVQYEDALSYDQYHIIYGPTLWATATPVFDNSEPENYPLPHPDTDDFLWPQVEVTPSPVDGMSRIWVLVNNSGSNGSSPGSNVVFGYTDANVAAITDIANLTWTWATIPELDAMDVDGDDWNRAFISLIASSDGSKIAIVGHTLGKTGDSESPCVFLNENYGEGDFTYYHTDYEGEYGEFRFITEDPLDYFGSDSLFVSYSQAGHFSANFVGAADEKIVFVTNMGLQTMQDSWYPSLLGVKSTSFDLNTHEFGLKDITPIRYEDDGTKLLPDNTNNTPNLWWDIDEDGVIDETYTGDDGVEKPSMISEYPIYNPNTDNAFHYNTNKIAINKEYNLIAAVWSDGTMAKYAADYPDDPDYASWATAPEIAIAVSNDNGDTWSEPLKLNGNPTDVSEEDYVGGYVEALDGMIPSFVYPSETVEDIEEIEGELWGTVHFLFLDDNTYGSEIIDSAPATGGMMKYMSLRLNFGPGSGANDGNTSSVPAVSTLSNYPNPFNPTTTINYTTKVAGNVNVGVYNIKGQLVKTLVNKYQTADAHSVTWNGNDENGNKSVSGVYFYKLSTNDTVEVQKMLMLK